MFQTIPETTEGQFIYDLGNKQWTISKFQELLEKIIPNNRAIEDFEAEHEFPKIGHKTLRLNARRMIRKQAGEEFVLLAMEM